MSLSVRRGFGSVRCRTQLAKKSGVGTSANYCLVRAVIPVAEKLVVSEPNLWRDEIETVDCWYFE